MDAGSGENDNIPGQGLDGGPGGEDVNAAETGQGEGFDAGEKGSNRPGGGVTLNAGREEEFNSSNHKNFYDTESHVQRKFLLYAFAGTKRLQLGNSLTHLLSVCFHTTEFASKIKDKLSS